MTHASHPTHRCLPLALAGALLLLIALVAASPAEAVYGGLGVVGTKITSGTEGHHGQVNPEGRPHGHALAVNPETGQFYIADELQPEAGKPTVAARVQEFSPKGEFLAENQVKYPLREGSPVERVGGLAVDPTLKRVYLLLDEERIEDKPKIEKELEKLEEKSTRTEAAITKKKEQIAKAKSKGESTAQLEQELKELEKQLKEEEAQEEKLKAEEEPRDPGDFAASDLYSFSTEISGEKLKEQHLLTDAEVLNSASEEPKASLLYPAGIAVDPATHDVVILGQQDESNAAAQEEPRAAVQRLHESGTLGPRYVDKANCLDEAEPVSAEPACAEDEAEFPTSPIVTTNGRVYAELGEEIWEIPASTEAGAGFKEIAVTPRHLYELEGENVVLKGTLPEEEGGALSFVPGKAPGEGTMYMRAQFPNAGQNGVVALSYNEGGGTPEAKEIGWTGGQEALSSQQKCVVPGGSTQQPLVAGVGGEDVLMLSYASGRVMEFGPNGEGCGHRPTATPPSVEAGGKPHATEVAIGATTKLSSKVEGARVKSVKWKFKYKNPQTGETGEEEAQTGYQIETATSLSHAFKHEGVYEISETVETDSLAYPTITAETVKVDVWDITAALAPPAESIAAQAEATFEASVKDHVEEATAHLKVVWKFGDGTPAVEESKEGASPMHLTVTHTFAKPGSYEVTLELKDDSGGHAMVKMPVEVSEGQDEKEARKRAEQERAEKEAHERSEREAHERSEREAHERSEREAHEREAKEKEEKGVLGETVTRNPEAKLASTSVSVSPTGTLTIKLTCPVGETSCVGTVTLQTLSAVSTAAHKKKAILTLTSGSFTVAGGQTKALTLHLSSGARSLLGHSRVLRALATIVAHDSAGVTRTVKTSVTLRLVEPRK
jgi:PKD repeat protein